MNPEIFTLSELQDLAFAFETLAKKKNATLIEAGSKFEAASLVMMEMLDTFRREIPHDSKRDHRDDWRRALSLGDILRKVMAHQNHPLFDAIWPHLLLLLGDGEFAQNLFSPKEDQNPNKVFELYVALLILPLCSRMDLDDPEASSGGKNPDVIAEINGEKWAFACKAMHSPLTKSLLDRVRHGIEQIEVTDAAKGVIVVSLKNVLNHEELWPVTQEPETGDYIYSCDPDRSRIEQCLQRECNRYQTELLELLGGLQGFRNVFSGSRVYPVILVHLCTVGSVRKNGHPTFQLIRMLASIQTEPLPDEVQEVFWLMNEMLHERYLAPEKLKGRFAGL
jgi:hypothetical protein